MKPSILIAGIGNIFNRDDAFGVVVARRLTDEALPENVRVRDFGIRGFDFTMALLEEYELTILVDAMARGGAPGSVYTIEPDLDALGAEDTGSYENAHSLDPVKALAAAKRLGARFGRVIVVGCEPAVLEDETGLLGLTDAVAAAVEPAVEVIHGLVNEFLKLAGQAGGLSYERQIA